MISILCGGTQLFMVCTFNWCELQWSLLCGDTQFWYAPLIDVNCNDLYTVWGTQLFMVCTFNWCELQWYLLCGALNYLWYAPLIDVNCSDLYCVGTLNYLWYAPLLDVNCSDLYTVWGTQLFMVCTFNWCELQWSLLCGDTQLFMVCTFNWCELQWSLYCKGALNYLWYAPLIDVNCNDLYSVGHSIIYGMHL